MHDLESSKFNKHAWLCMVMQSALSDGSKLVSMALWRFSSESGFCWPSQNQIAQAIGHKSIGRISQYTTELASAGVIRIDYVQGNGKYKSANYQLITPTDVQRSLPVFGEFCSPIYRKARDLFRASVGSLSMFLPPEPALAIIKCAWRTRIRIPNVYLGWESSGEPFRIS